jgi:thiosulfate/3-mercaptopyruvate sulfurtransferase
MPDAPGLNLETRPETPACMGNLVSCEEAAKHLDDPAWLFVDVRHELADAGKGAREHAASHIPGAIHAHMDRDLASPVGDGSRGRHPLPDAVAFAKWCARAGITPQTRVVCYDHGGGQWASRLWWLLRFHRHETVALLDGGLARWTALGLPTRSGPEAPRAPARFVARPGAMPTVDVRAVETSIPAHSLTLLDARAAQRFRGEVEPVDKRAGHIPGAVNVPFASLVGPDQRLLAGEELRRIFAAAGAHSAKGVVCYCGSGVTSTHLVLAMEEAGLGTPALYVGSWSEWSWPAAGRAIETSS